jgi:hypothetical protein
MCGKSMKIHEKSQVSTQEMHGKTGTMTLGILGSSCHHPSHGCDGLGNTSWCALKDGLGVVAALTIPSYRLVQNGLYHNMDQHGHFRGKHSSMMLDHDKPIGFRVHDGTRFSDKNTLHLGSGSRFEMFSTL